MSYDRFLQCVLIFLISESVFVCVSVFGYHTIVYIMVYMHVDDSVHPILVQTTDIPERLNLCTTLIPSLGHYMRLKLNKCDDLLINFEI